MEDKYLTAYYEENAELKAITRNLLSVQLPINLQNSLKDELSNGWITELFEMASHGETYYFATIENAEQKITLKSVNTSEWSTVSKEDKL